ncbi:TPA: hypothetical protein ACGUTA_004304 [Vibrio vulnificus]
MNKIEVVHFDGTLGFSDEEYLVWIENNLEGYVVNYDVDGNFPDYPMVHLSSHKSISSSSRTNYTTGKYRKICSNNLDALEVWTSNMLGKSVTKCRVCMK